VAGLCAGDANAQYFKILAAKRRRRDHIASLRLGSQVFTEQAEKEEVATQFYVGLLGTAQPREHDLDLQAVGLHAANLSELEQEFSEEEVWGALRAMPNNKSPGPDGFSWEFYRHCWPVIKEDVMRALRAIWSGRE
jgi:hypothetical protein